MSAIDLAISLRSFSFLSFAILLLWSLSPLGGQSSLRLLAEANTTVTISRAIYYPKNDSKSWLLEPSPFTRLNQVSVVVSTSISTADTLSNSSVDAWNHPKVPRLRPLELLELENNKLHPWIDVDEGSAADYTSLTGLSIVGLEADTVANFSVPYAYMYADCKAHMRGSSKEIKAFFDKEIGLSKTGQNQLHPSGWPYPQRLNSPGGEFGYLFNVSYLLPTNNLYYESSFFLVSPQNLTVEWGTTDHVFYGTKDAGSDGQPRISLYKCSLHDIDVEAHIACSSAACRTTRLRRIIVPRPPITDPRGVNTTSGAQPVYDDSVLPISQPWQVLNHAHYLRNFIQYFPTIGGMTSGNAFHPVDNYIYGNLSTDGPPTSYFTADIRIERNWAAVPDAHISQRLTEILNTYWEASRWFETTIRSDPYGVSSMNRTAREPFAELRMNATTASVASQVPIYRASVPWILTLGVCSGTLLLLGVANVVVARQTAMPDVLGAVSSLTRENEFVELPPGGSGLDGMDRSRLIRDLNVQLCDVQPGEEVGRVALRSIKKDEDVKGAKVERDRLYI